MSRVLNDLFACNLSFFVATVFLLALDYGMEFKKLLCAVNYFIEKLA